MESDWERIDWPRSRKIFIVYVKFLSQKVVPYFHLSVFTHVHIKYISSGYFLPVRLIIKSHLVNISIYNRKIIIQDDVQVLYMRRF